MIHIKSHFTTLYLCMTISCSLLILLLINRHESLPVTGIENLLFEHQTTQGNIILARNLYDELTLAFLARNIGGLEKTAYQIRQEEETFTHLTLASDDVPFVVHAIVMHDPQVHEILLISEHLPIAHRALAQTLYIEDAHLFLFASSDISEQVLLIGLDTEGHVVFEYETFE